MILVGRAEEKVGNRATGSPCHRAIGESNFKNSPQRHRGTEKISSREKAFTAEGAEEI
jgi:hypothetical protein